MSIELSTLKFRQRKSSRKHEWLQSKYGDTQGRTLGLNFGVLWVEFSTVLASKSLNQRISIYVTQRICRQHILIYLKFTTFSTACHKPNFGLPQMFSKSLVTFSIPLWRYFISSLTAILLCRSLSLAGDFVANWIQVSTPPKTYFTPSGSVEGLKATTFDDMYSVTRPVYLTRVIH